MRVSVVGTSCSGKSTFGAALAARTGLVCHDLDEIFWQPGWEVTAPPAFRASVEAIVAGDAWIVTGNYGLVREVIWRRATHVVWLDFPFPLVLARAVRRTARRIVTGETICNGNRESLAKTLFDRESILLWVARTWRKNRRQYAAAVEDPRWAHLRFLRLRSQREADEALAKELG